MSTHWRWTMRSKLSILRTLAVIAAVVPLSCAQATERASSVTITVTDPSGAAVLHAQIKVLPWPQATKKNLETNEYGKVLLNLTSGGYDVFVTNPEFKPWNKHIQVQDASEQSIAAVLQFAETSTEVVLCAPCLPIQTDSHSPAPKPPGAVPIAISVADESGGAVPFAQISMNSQTAGKAFEADESGKVSLRLIPGRYALWVTSPGFKRWAEHVEVLERGNQVFAVTLRVGGCPSGPCPVVH